MCFCGSITFIDVRSRIVSPIRVVIVRFVCVCGVCDFPAVCAAVIGKRIHQHLFTRSTLCNTRARVGCTFRTCACHDFVIHSFSVCM